MKITRDGNSISIGKATISLFSCVEIGGRKIDWAGEYQIDGFFFRVFDCGENGLAFRIVTNGVRFFFPARKLLSEEDIDFDVLFVLTEDAACTPKEWKGYIEGDEPRVVIFVGEGEKTNTLKRDIGVASLDSAQNLDIDSKKFTAEKTLFYSL